MHVQEGQTEELPGGYSPLVTKEVHSRLSSGGRFCSGQTWRIFSGQIFKQYYLDSPGRVVEGLGSIRSKDAKTKRMNPETPESDFLAASNHFETLSIRGCFDCKSFFIRTCASILTP
jgi:hypothetical protein